MGCTDGVPQELLDEARNAQDKTAWIRDKKLENARKYKLMKMTKAKQEELYNLLDEHPEGAISALNSMLSGDIYKKATGSNVEYRTHAIVGQTHAKFVDLIEELSTTKFGFDRNKALADDVVKELFGDTTGNAKAKNLAKQWEEASEFLRKRFNDAGGTIGKLEKWGMPQSHNQVKVARADVDDWIDFIKPLLKNADDLDLRRVYDTISTGGMNKMRKGALDASKPRIGGGKMKANTHTDPRVLSFKDGESWLTYQKKFGEEDPLSTMLDHVRLMSNDIAMVEVLGPNPDNMFKTLMKEVEYRDAMGEGTKRSLSSKLMEADPEKLYAIVSGRVDTSAANTMLSREASEVLGTLRNIQTATKLGSAQLSAVSDLGTLAVNVKYHGMSLSKVMKTFGKNFNISNQKEAARMGFSADVFNSSISSRYNETAKGWSAKTSEAVIRAQGMAIWTEAARKAFQTEFYNHLRHLKTELKGMPDIFKEYGWKQKDFDKLDFDNLDMQQQTRLLEMVNQEADYAVMMPTARARVLTTWGAEKGTVAGEISRFGMQFKSFPVTFMIQQMSRSFLQGSFISRAKYAAAMTIATTIMGGIAVMAKDAAKGYTPRDGSPLSENQDAKDMGKFWAAAITQGGGLGIFGDYLFSDQNRYGGSGAPTLLGPAGGTLESAGKLTVGNIQEVIQGKDTHFGSELVDFVNREVNPLNLWYSKALIEYYVTDNIKSFLDPDYDKAKRRRAKKRKKEYGQEKYEFLQD